MSRRRRSHTKTAADILARPRRNLIRVALVLVAGAVICVAFFGLPGGPAPTQPDPVMLSAADLERWEAAEGFPAFPASVIPSQTRALQVPGYASTPDGFMIGRFGERWLVIDTGEAIDAGTFHGRLVPGIPRGAVPAIWLAGTDRPPLYEGVLGVHLSRAVSHDRSGEAWVGVLAALAFLGCAGWAAVRAIRMLPDPETHPAFKPLARDRDRVEAMSDLDDALADDPPPGSARWVYTAGNWLVCDSRWDAWFVELDDVRRYTFEKRRVSGTDANADLPISLTTYLIHVELADGRRVKLQCRGRKDMDAALDEMFDALGFDCHESLRAMLAEREEEREVAAQLRSQSRGRSRRRRG